MLELEFKRIVRKCEFNERAKQTGEPIIYDFEVWIAGERRAVFKREIRGRGYDLAIHSGNYFELVKERIPDVRYQPVAKANTKADFGATIERLLAANAIPTLAEVEARKIAKAEAETIAALEAKAEQSAEARLQRFAERGDAMISAAKNAIEVMKNMRQGAFRGAVARLQKQIDFIEGTEIKP